MFDRYFEMGDKLAFIDDDHIILLKSENALDFVDLKNEIDALNEKKDSLIHEISYNQNILAKRDFPKQRLSKILKAMYFVLGIICVSVYIELPISLLYIIGYVSLSVGVIIVDNILQKGAKIDCDKKIRQCTKMIDRYNFEINCLENRLNKIKNNSYIENIKINKIEELKSLKESLTNKLDNEEKIIIKRRKNV